MGSPGNQQTWVPYETSKDCSQGFCSIYCPQWCYIIFPPPPPFNFSEESSGPNFSPLVIAIIGILGSAFLLVTYYTIISKFCGNFDFLRRRLNRDDRVDVHPDDSNNDPSRHESWNTATLNGLEESIIKAIGVCKYKRGDGLVEGTDCSVCLSEFREDESLRLLPKCSHAFHVPCIDTWLKSHTNCPLCRSNIISACTTAAAPPEFPAPMVAESSPPTAESQHDQEMVVEVVAADMEDQQRGLEENKARTGDAVSTSKDPLQEQTDFSSLEERHSIIEIEDDRIQPIRRSVSMDAASCRGRISIAEVLGMNMDDDLLDSVGASGLSRGFREEHGKSSRRRRVLHSVVSPVPMKRSVSSGRFCFTRHGSKGNNFTLPV